jgi:hypothetical protein
VPGRKADVKVAEWFAPEAGMWKTLPPAQRRLLALWVVGLAVLYGVITTAAVLVVRGEKRTADTNHALRMSADKVEPGLTPPDPLPASGDFVRVSVGLYVDNVDTFSIKDSYWSATFYVWFQWSGDRGLDPARTFQLVDARIEKRDVLEQYTGDGGINYQRVRATARMAKFFNTTRVPLDDHLLTITVEDGERDGMKLRYEADPESGISSRVKISGYRVADFSYVVKNHTYRTSYGDPRITPGARRTFTQFLFGMHVQRASVGLYFKLLLGLFAGSLLALCSLFIRPPTASPRFSLPTAAYFGAVANSYLVSSMLPSTGQFGLVDYATGLGLFTIFICLTASLMSLYVYLIHKDEAFSKAIDRSTFATVLVLYLFANILLPLSAFINL